MKLFVGNITTKVTEEDLKNIFAHYGDVIEVRIVVDKYTRESRGFGYVTMGDPESGISAIKKLNGKKYKGRKLQVNQARTQVIGRKGENRRNGLPRYAAT
jgi:RNA recognition motif-containing protein